MRFAAFMSTLLGRGLRVALGGVLIYVGLAVVQGRSGTFLAALGVLPIVAGLLNLCLIGRLLGAPLRGSSSSAPRT